MSRSPTGPCSVSQGQGCSPQRQPKSKAWVECQDPVPWHVDFRGGDVGEGQDGDLGVCICEGGLWPLPGCLCEVPSVLYSVPPKHGLGDVLLFLAPSSSRPEGRPSILGGLRASRAVTVGLSTRRVTRESRAGTQADSSRSEQDVLALSVSTWPDSQDVPGPLRWGQGRSWRPLHSHVFPGIKRRLGPLGGCPAHACIVASILSWDPLSSPPPPLPPTSPRRATLPGLQVEGRRKWLCLIIYSSKPFL